MNVNPYNTTYYENKSNWTLGENKPNTNPIRTQSNPKQTQSKPIQCQNKPNQTQLQTAPGEVIQTLDPVVIGRRGGTYNDKYFDGIIDDVRIYDKALSHAEVAYLATEGAPSLYTPLDSPAELYTDEAEGYRYVNFKDFAVMADMWLDEQLFP